MPKYQTDIIHPRNQGGEPEAGFVESYVERKARIAAAKPKTKPKKANGPKPAIHTSEQVNEFTRQYKARTSTRAMAQQFGVTQDTIWKTAKRLGLRRIRPEANDEDERYVNVTAWITYKEYRTIIGSIGKTRGAMADFLRSAIRYKIGNLPGGMV